VVGTANRGPLNEVRILGSYSEALDTFGNYDRWPGTEAAPALTLTRALEQIFRGGGSTVYAVRVANLPADQEVKSMSWTVAGAAADLFKLTATSPGTWANGIVAKLSAPENKPVTLELVLGRLKETFTAATAGALVKEIASGSRLVTASGWPRPIRTRSPRPSLPPRRPIGAGRTALRPRRPKSPRVSTCCRNNR